MALATPVVFWAGWPFFERAWASVVNRSPNMFTLIALGVGAAYVYSAVATVAPGFFPDGFRMHGVVRDLLRHRGRHHRARPARAGARAARAQPDQHRDPAAARPRAEDRARRPRRRRARRAARRGAGRRHLPRPARREGAGRRRRRRGAQRRRRVDGDRRADPGREGARRTRHRRHDQHDRQPARSAPSGSAATRCSRRSSAWSARRSAAARRFSGSPIGSPPTSCRRSCSSRSWPSWRGASGGRRRGWRTRWSAPWPC